LAAAPADRLPLAYERALSLLSSGGQTPAAPLPGAPALPLLPAAPTPTPDDGKKFYLRAEDIASKAQHLDHDRIFGKYVSGFNRLVLQGIDTVQKNAPDGGGYFIGPHATPPESPIGYALSLFGSPLLVPPRPTSFCTGASYAAFIEALNLIFAGSFSPLSPERAEALRMQEPDGSRRQDGVKFWGRWNGDDYGNLQALVNYSGLGVVVSEKQARPGDFMNISWKNGRGHAVVFLGWFRAKDGSQNVLYWSSQTGTNGLGDQLADIGRIAETRIVRLTRPERLFTFDVAPATAAMSGFAFEPNRR
jgi:hypothetical protein